MRDHELITDFLVSGRELFDSALSFVPLETPEALDLEMPHTKLVFEGEEFGWLVLTEEVAGRDPYKTSARLRWYGQVLSKALGGHLLAERLGDELMISWNELRFMYSVTQKVAQTTELEAIFESLVELLRDTFGAEAALIAQPGGNMKTISIGTEGKLSDLRVTRMVNRIALENQTVLVNTPEDSLDFVPDGLLDSMLAVNIESQVARPCVIAVFTYVNSKTKKGKRADSFGSTHRLTLEAISELMGALIDNAELHRRETRSMRIQAQIDIAAAIQKSLLPAKLPEIEGYEISAGTKPAGQVGGDFYDVFEMPSGHIGLIVADVAGKGVPAAMLTSSLRIVLRSQMEHNYSPANILLDANRVLYPDMSRVDLFATVFLAVFYPETGQITWANAGHSPALWYRANTGEERWLMGTSLPLGIYDDLKTDYHAGHFGGRDLLCIYSDGLSEAENADGRFFGKAGLAETLRIVPNTPVDVTKQFLLDVVNTFSAEQRMGDDQTLLLMGPQRKQGTKKYQNFSVQAEISQLSELRRLFLGLVASHEKALTNTTWYMEAELALQELASNIIEHAYAYQPGLLTGLFTISAEALTIDLIDAGNKFVGNLGNLESLEDNLLTEGGFGLHIITKTMDACNVERLASGLNHWQLRKNLNS